MNIPNRMRRSLNILLQASGYHRLSRNEFKVYILLFRHLHRTGKRDRVSIKGEITVKKTYFSSSCTHRRPSELVFSSLGSFHRQRTLVNGPVKGINMTSSVRQPRRNIPRMTNSTEMIYLSHGCKSVGKCCRPALTYDSGTQWAPLPQILANPQRFSSPALSFFGIARHLVPSTAVFEPSPL